MRPFDFPPSFCLTSPPAILTFCAVSRLPFEISLALRYLRPKRTFVSVITIISVLGVMLGVAVLMIVIAVMSGFDREWRDRILSFNAHLKIMRPAGVIQDWETPLRIATNNPLVKGAAPFVLGQIMIETQPPDTNQTPIIRGPILRGIDPSREQAVSSLPKSVIHGEFDVSGNGVLVGIEMARDLSLHVGDHLAIISPETLAKWQKAHKSGRDDEAVLPDDYEVRGIFDVGFNDFNSMLVATSLRNAQRLYNIGGHVHGINVMLHDPFLSEEARLQLMNSLGREYHIVTWTEENATIFGALANEKMMMYIILFVIMVVAAFVTMNSEITFTVNKTKEIGLLKSLGASNHQVMGIFMGHSVAVGVLGVGLGFALGMLVIKNLNNILHFVRKVFGYDLLPASIYQVSELPYHLLPMDVAIICGGSFLACVLAGLLPAWKASRLQPVEAMRNE